MSVVVQHKFLDFDGTLAIPYTMPEQPYAHIPALLQQWHANHISLHLVSFNPRAWVAIQAWGCAHYFTSVRVGCNTPWPPHEDLTFYKHNAILLRAELCKSRQIASILHTELALTANSLATAEFYDDDERNIMAVRAAYPNFSCYMVETQFGLIL
jgi:hypothetical protein